jgi:hypothetical protein
MPYCYAVNLWPFVGSALLQFEYYGSSCWSATFMGNSVKGSQYGDSMLCFASDGAVITWSLPTIHIRGEAAALCMPQLAGYGYARLITADTSACLWVNWQMLQCAGSVCCLMALALAWQAKQHSWPL